MSQLLLSLQDVSVRYPDLSVFHHIHFTVYQGQHTALAGPCEPLKSALIDAMAGRVAIVQGTKTFHPFKDGETGRSVAPVALVSARHTFKNLSNTADFYYQQRFNSADSDNAFTVLQYLEQVAQKFTDSRILVQQLVAKLRLEALAHEGVIKLSNGETRRVLLAAALLQQPALLLLHNPLAGLDTASRAEITQLIDEVAATGCTVVMTVQHHPLPTAIHQVAVVNKPGDIHCMAAKQFLPGNTLHTPVQLPYTTIKALLARTAMPRFNTMVHLQQVNIAYPGKQILRDINWTIRQGERWVLRGPNGAGKSTLLSLITGDNPQAFANHIVLFDRRKGTGESIWDIKKHIGFFSPEMYQCFPLDTQVIHAVESGFYDTIGLFRPSHPATSAICMQWLQVFGLAGKAHKLLRHVSPAEQRLCLLARAMVKNPALLVLDEPCQGFDDQQVEWFKALIDCIAANTLTTIMYVSHYPHEIPRSIHQVFELRDGKQVEHPQKDW